MLEAIKGVTRSNYGSPLIFWRGLPATDAWARRYDGHPLGRLLRSIPAQRILPGSEDYELVAMLNVGYPAPDSKPSAMHGERKMVGELVTRIG